MPKLRGRWIVASRRWEMTLHHDWKRDRIMFNLLWLGVDVQPADRCCQVGFALLGGVVNITFAWGLSSRLDGRHCDYCDC